MTDGHSNGGGVSVRQASNLVKGLGANMFAIGVTNRLVVNVNYTQKQARI